MLASLGTERHGGTTVARSSATTHRLWSPIAKAVATRHVISHMATNLNREAHLRDWFPAIEPVPSTPGTLATATS